MEFLFSEFISEGNVINNLDSNNIDVNLLTSIKMRINLAAAIIGYARSWEWRKKTFYMTTTAPYSTGTITLTQGSKTVTGSGTVFANSMRLGYVLYNSKTYKINRITSDTVLVLESAFPDTTVSGVSYQIIFPDYFLDHRIASIVNVKVAGVDIDVKSRDKIILPASSIGMPSEAAISERTLEDYYNTGTVTITANSPTVTGSGTGWSSEMEGMAFRVDEFSKKYTIKTVNSSTSITLTQNYEGSSGSGKTHKINPAGSAVLTFRVTPSDYFWVEIEALIHIPKMINNNDVSMIPVHQCLMSAVRWQLFDLKNENPVVVQQKEADAIKQIDDMAKIYKSVNVKWISNEEIRARRLINATTIDPFSY